MARVERGYSLSDDKIREIAEMLDCGHICYLNPDTLETLFTLNPGSWEYYEESEDDIKIHEQVDRWEKRITLAPPESFESFKFMEGFIDELPERESALKNRLVSALSHSHPFSWFKAVIDNCPYRQEWFAYKQKCLEAYVRDEIPFDKEIH